MPFNGVLNSLKNKVNDVKREYSSYSGQQQSQHQQYPGQQQQQNYLPQPNYGSAPPQVPMDTHPSNIGTTGRPPPSANPTTYWQPRFESSIPVSTDWEHKQGNNNGWGNSELENYTSDPKNSFHTADNKLVVRAISTPSSNDPSQKYTSARLVSRQTLSRPRGCLTGVLTSPCAGGIWPAFWLLPREPFTWPGDGEIDIAETWNGDQNNKSCLHWGFFTPGDSRKHRALGTDVPGMASGRAVKYEFAWDQDEGSGKGRLMWWIDGNPVMRAEIPDGIRRLKDFNVLLNVAMGGNVCAGQTPREGSYDFVVHELRMSGDPDGGWARFGSDWNRAREGNFG